MSKQGKEHCQIYLTDYILPLDGVAAKLRIGSGHLAVKGSNKIQNQKFSKNKINIKCVYEIYVLFKSIASIS